MTIIVVSHLIYKSINKRNIGQYQLFSHNLNTSSRFIMKISQYNSRNLTKYFKQMSLTLKFFVLPNYIAI